MYMIKIHVRSYCTHNTEWRSPWVLLLLIRREETSPWIRSKSIVVGKESSTSFFEDLKGVDVDERVLVFLCVWGDEERSWIF